MPTDADIFAPLPAIEAALAAAIADADATPTLKDAIAYATLGAGKRIRPLLTWHCCTALGGNGENALPACVAVELVHCFSLVHDDLPALDNDELRRGKPTVHVKFGEPMAVLAGDAMLNMAAQSLTCAWRAENERTQRARSELIAVLSGATAAMIKGQVADTLHDFPPGLTEPSARLEFIHRNKTGALLVAACVMGTCCARIRAGDVPQARSDSIARYAETLGLLFQAVDDLLDVTQSPEETGKKTQKDADAGKLTFPGVYGIPKTRSLIAQYHADAIAVVQTLGPHADALVRIAELVATRTK